MGAGTGGQVEQISEYILYSSLLGLSHHSSALLGLKLHDGVGAGGVGTGAGVGGPGAGAGVGGPGAGAGVGPHHIAGVWDVPVQSS